MASLASSSSAKPTPQYLVLGKIVRPHGIRGDIRLEIMTSFPDRLRNLEVVYVDRDPEAPKTLKPLHILQARPEKNNHWLLRFDEVLDRDEAEALRDQFLFVPLENAVPLEDGEAYLFQVMGMNVVTEAGEFLGKVVEFIETGANDVYVVRGEAYGEILIPAIDGVILSIDINTNQMQVKLPDGLLSE